MHVRVLLSKYRSYTPCPDCGGSRLKPDATPWRLGQDTGTPPYRRFMPVHAAWSRAQPDALPGLGVHHLMRLPLEQVRAFFTPTSLDRTYDVYGMNMSVQ